MDYGKPALELKNDKGQVTLYRPRPDVVVVVSVGFLTSDMWTRQVPFYENASEVRSFEPDYRAGQQDFGKKHKDRFREIVFHQKSALVAMAINAAKLFTGANVSAVDRATFDQRLSAALSQKAA